MQKEDEDLLELQFGELPIYKVVKLSSGRTINLKTTGNGFIVYMPRRHLKHFHLLDELYTMDLETSNSVAVNKIKIPEGNVASANVFQILVNYYEANVWPVKMETQMLYHLIAATDYLQAQKALDELLSIVALLLAD